MTDRQASTASGTAPREDEAQNLQGLLEQLSRADKESGRISVEAVLDAVGRRAFGPALLVPGLITLSPLSGIPGMPTTVGVMVALVTAQLLMGRDRFWLPGILLRRSLSHDRFQRALKALAPVARFVDKLIRPRLQALTGRTATFVIAATCLALAVGSPVLELLPFAATVIGATFTAFALALVAHDGVLALLAFGFSIATVTVIATVLL